jgi:phosphomannomutase
VAHLMTGVSGVRGIFGDGLDESVAERFAYAFGGQYHGRIVVGRDSRRSGKRLADAVISGLRKAGADAVDLGLVTTPGVEMAVIARGASGGVIVTASHNPGEWNGLKFLGPDGVFLDASQGAALLDGYRSTGPLGGISPTGGLDRWDEANAHHIESVLALDIIDADLIAASNFIVCLDAVNGAGGDVCTTLLEHLGCIVKGINTTPSGVFAHGAEPISEHLGELCALVRDTGADVGFAVDPDVDRLALVDDRANAPGEEYTLALAADFLFGKGLKSAVCNLSTSRMIDDAAECYGAVVHRSPVGEINVVQAMRALGVEFGGEGNGGIIYPPLHSGRDAVLGMALILQYLAETKKTLGGLVAEFPEYTMVKEKIALGGSDGWRETLLGAFPDAVADTRDGVKLTLGRSWVHVRPSNTEPVVRIIAEAPSRREVDVLLARARSAVV